MQLRATSVLVAAVLCLAPAVTFADLSPYSQDFEGLVQADGGALAADGWLVFGNIFDPSFNYLYGYGPFAAPNGGPPYAFCTIASGEGGATQGNQQLVVFSDYNSGEHGNGNLVESNVFQEQVIGAADLGNTWEFHFDAKRGDLVAPSTALAFIKILEPAPSFALTNFITLDMTALPTTWGSFTLVIYIDPALENHILQIGFANTTTNYAASGIVYDNINFDVSTPTPVETTTWGRVKSLYR